MVVRTLLEDFEVIFIDRDERIKRFHIVNEKKIREFEK
jgi:hypothetical protein